MRVAMQRDGQHVFSAPKNALRAIAVMNINVQNRHPVVFAAQVLRCNGTIVQVGEPVGTVRIGMVPGWSTQGIGGPLAVEH